MAYVDKCISIMLACRFSECPIEEVGVTVWDSAKGKQAREWLQMFELVDENYRATERGRIWVSMLTATPLPESQWVDPRNGEVAN